MMNANSRTRWILGLLLAVGSVSAKPSDHKGTSDAATSSRPNVLFILCDDLRPDALGCYGSRHVKTPHIDSLAARGVRFANAFCTTSLCSPSRASILTGLYARRHGVRDNFTELPTGLPHWPGRLREQGYATAYIGKWHMGEDNDGPRPGFDWFVTHKGQGKYFDTEWNVNGLRREAPEGYYTRVVTDYALDWLRHCERDRPWALCLGHKAPHSFYFPEEKYGHVFDDIRVPYPDTAFALDGKPEWIRQRLRTWHGIYGPLFDWRKNFPDDRPEAVKDFENMVHAYWGTVLSVDDSVGQLVAYLRESGQLENTVIVFMGDNGLLEGEHGMVDKRTMHEPSIRIPLIVSGPHHPAGRTVAQQVLTVDIASSLLDVCGAPPLADVQGRSWRRLVNAGDSGWRTAWFYEYNYEKQFPYTPNVRGIRTDEWKYIRYPTGDSTPDKHLPELYHLSDDPQERHNLAADPKFASTRRRLETRLADLLAAGSVNGQDTMPLDEGIKAELPDPKIRQSRNSTNERNHMKQSVLCGVIAVWATVGLAAESTPQANQARPNIVYFLVDDLGYADVGFMGSRDVRTPSIDRLAREGAVLSSFYVQPVCSPTRSTLMTGRYVTRTGVYSVVRPGAPWGLPLAERTLPQALHEAGYTTAICGKWHLGEFQPGYMPTRRGFDHQYGHMFGALDYFTHIRDGKHDWYRDDKPLQEEGYTTHLIAREACRLIRAQPADRPLFLYVPFNGVHSPYQVPEEYRKAYPLLRGNRQTMAAMLSAVDEAIGQITTALEERGLRENTLIIFSSDNGGPSPGRVSRNTPLRAGKGTIYEGGVRVCAFATWPGRIRAGTTISEPMHAVDWYPTLLKAAGAPLEQKLPLDGLDAWPMLTQGAKSPHDAILLAGTSPSQMALRMGDWKLLVDAGEWDAAGVDWSAARVELYNLAEDIGESKDRAASQPQKVKEMRDRLAVFLKDAAPPGQEAASRATGAGAGAQQQ